MRSELMAAIYDKALKRRDYSGIVDKEKEKEERERRASVSASASASASASGTGTPSGPSNGQASVRPTASSPTGQKVEVAAKNCFFLPVSDETT
jgi:hypothetical protein